MLRNFWDLGIISTRLLGYFEINKPYSTILGMEQKTEIRGQKSEDRSQRTENRGERA
jgi:hypothetical protein